MTSDAQMRASASGWRIGQFLRGIGDSRTWGMYLAAGRIVNWSVAAAVEGMNLPFAESAKDGAPSGKGWPCGHGRRSPVPLQRRLIAAVLGVGYNRSFAGEWKGTTDGPCTRSRSTIPIREKLNRLIR